MKTFVTHLNKLIVLTAVSVTATAVHAQPIDDFSSGLSPYTMTPILYNSSGDTTTISFTDPSGGLQVNSANYGTLEQAVFLRDDYTLGIGQTLTADINWNLFQGGQDFGLCIANTATPTAASPDGTLDTRPTFSFLYLAVRTTSSHVIANGFDSTASALGLDQFQGSAGMNATSLFITRTSATTFDVGYDLNDSGNVVLGSYTLNNSSDVGDAIGFYADMRGNYSLGVLDNLNVVPEPSTIALIGIGGLVVIFSLRRRGFKGMVGSFDRL